MSEKKLSVQELGELLEKYKGLKAEADQAEDDLKNLKAATEDAKKTLLDAMILSETPVFVHGERCISAAYKCKYQKGKGVSDEELFEALRAAGMGDIIQVKESVAAATLSAAVAEAAELNADEEGMAQVPDALAPVIRKWEYFDLSDTKATKAQLKAMAAMQAANM